MWAERFRFRRDGSGWASEDSLRPIHQETAPYELLSPHDALVLLPEVCKCLNLCDFASLREFILRFLSGSRIGAEASGGSESCLVVVKSMKRITAGLDCNRDMKYIE